MLSHLVCLALAASPLAQDLANANRQLESAVATKTSTERLQAEVNALREAWVREGLKSTRGLPLEARVARYYRLLALTSASAPALADTTKTLGTGEAIELRREVEAEARATLSEWLDQGDALLTTHHAVRVLALRRQFVEAVGRDSPLASLRSDLDAKAHAQLQLGEEPFARYTSAAIASLVAGAAVTVPDDLVRDRVLRDVPHVDSACSEKTFSLPVRRDGVAAQMNVSVGACDVQTRDSAARRSLPYEGIVMVTKTVEVVVGTRQEMFTEDRHAVRSARPRSTTARRFSGRAHRSSAPRPRREKCR